MQFNWEEVDTLFYCVHIRSNSCHVLISRVLNGSKIDKLKLKASSPTSSGTCNAGLTKVVFNHRNASQISSQPSSITYLHAWHGSTVSPNSKEICYAHAVQWLTYCGINVDSPHLKESRGCGRPWDHMYCTCTPYRIRESLSWYPAEMIFHMSLILLCFSNFNFFSATSPLIFWPINHYNGKSVFWDRY